MRMYEVKTGKRFGQDHPLWQAHMINKDGSVKKRMDKKKCAELESLGIITLVPSVTEIASVAGGFGVFGYASKWGRDMTVKAFSELFKEDAELTESNIESRAIKLMTQARDTGSELHEIFHLIETCALSVEQATDDQRTFYETCRTTLKTLNITDYKTEVEFATDEYGGTCDLTGKEGVWNVGLDWKSVEKFRDPRESELLQMGAYGNFFEWDRAYIVYYHQTEHTMMVHEMRQDELCNAYEAFRAALQLKKLIDIL